VVGFGVTRAYYFSKITNVEICQVLDQAMTLVQNWICKNVVIDLKNTKISKNHCVISNPFQQIVLKMIIIYL